MHTTGTMSSTKSVERSLYVLKRPGYKTCTGLIGIVPPHIRNKLCVGDEKTNMNIIKATFYLDRDQQRSACIPETSKFCASCRIPGQRAE